jgi:DNA polymerase III delta prime subunit
MRVSAKLMVMATVFVSLSGCATEFEKRFAKAERARVIAAEAGAEWLRTEELIKQAETEAARGDMERANSLLKLAQFQAETAIKQAQYEADAWSSRVVR